MWSKRYKSTTGNCVVYLINGKTMPCMRTTEWWDYRCQSDCWGIISPHPTIFCLYYFDRGPPANHNDDDALSPEAALRKRSLIALPIPSLGTSSARTTSTSILSKCRSMEKRLRAASFKSPEEESVRWKSERIPSALFWNERIPQRLSEYFFASSWMFPNKNFFLGA